LSSLRSPRREHAQQIGGAFYEEENGPSGLKKKHYVAGVAVLIDCSVERKSPATRTGLVNALER